MSFMDRLRVLMLNWDKDKIIMVIIGILIFLLFLFIVLYANLKKASEKYTIPLSEFYIPW